MSDEKISRTQRAARIDPEDPKHRLNLPYRSSSELPKKAYALSRGEYSDYEIISIFSTREMAEEQAKVINDRLVDEDYWNRVSVQEFPFDFDLAYIGPRITIARVRMFEDGSVEQDWTWIRKGSEYPLKDLKSNYRAAWWPYKNKGFLEVTIGRIDGNPEEMKKRIVKIANEKRVQLIALDKWPTKDGPEIFEGFD